MVFGIPALSKLTIGPLGSFLWKHKGTLLSVIAVSALLLYIMSLKDDVNKWKNLATERNGSISELNANLNNQRLLFEEQNASLVTLQKATDEQNEVIQFLNDTLKLKNDEILRMKKQREEEIKKREQELADLMAEQEAKDCPSAINFLIEGKGDLTW